MAPKKAKALSGDESNVHKKVKVENRSHLLDSVTMLFVLFGLAISFYALVVEHKAKLDAEYVALCDLSPSVSCSKVLTSEYAKLFSYLGLIPQDSVFNQPNTIYGIVYYVAFGVTYRHFRDYDWGKLLLMGLTTASMILCAYLAYILTVKLSDICIVCYLTYLCNIVMFVSAVINA